MVPFTSRDSGLLDCPPATSPRCPRRIWLAVVLAFVLFQSLGGAEAQPTTKMYRIGILWWIPPSFAHFQKSLAEAGYFEGRNLLFAHRWSTGQSGAFLDRAKELVGLKVDVLFATSLPAIRAAADSTTTIPIVVISVGDPIATGLARSLARPGRNITGLSARVQELNQKLLELLKESTPRASRIAVLGGTAVGLHRKEMELAAGSLGVRLPFVEITTGKELDAAFETVARARAEGVVLLPTVFVSANSRLVAQLALQRRLPSIFWASEFAEAGGLMAYGPDYSYLWRRAGAMTGSILNGKRPANLPMEQADRFRLVVNLNTAKARGLTIPQTLLLRADEVIE